MKNIYLFKAGKFDVAVMKSREIHNFFILNAYTSFWTVIEVSSLNIFKIFQKVMLFIIFLLNFSNLYGQTKKSQETSNEIVYNLKRSEELLQHNLDSANIYAERANRLINKGTSNKDRSRVNISLGNINSAQSNYVKALKYYFTAKQLIDQDIADGKSRSEEDLNINVLMNIGLSFYYQKSYSLAMQYFEEALQNILKMQNPDSQGAINFKQKIFNNIAAIKIQQKEFDKALEYYQNSLKVNAKIGDKNIESSLNNNIGICYMEKKEYELAKYYLEKSLDIRRSTNDWMGVAQCYNNIGKNNALMGNFALAKENLLKALEIENKLGNKESKLVSLQSLTQLYKEIGDYKNAFQSLEDAEVVKDSLYNIESAKKIAQLELQHKIDKQKKVFNLELKRRETEEQKRRLIYLVIAITLVLVSVILGLLVYLQRTKINNTKLQRDKLELEHLNISLEKQKLTEELDFKNRELTTNVMYLLKKNELINGIAEKLIQSKNDFKSENRKVIQEIITQLKSSNDEKIWSEFETHFTKVHSDFYHKLNEKFPNLSTNEKKLCAFLRLNLSTKDISTITYQSVNSITVARSRLRKKLNIQGEDTNLINFLTKL